MHCYASPPYYAYTTLKDAISTVFYVQHHFIFFTRFSTSISIFAFQVLYSLAGLGIAIVNDFKSIEGDAALGMNSLPVAFGVDKAK